MATIKRNGDKVVLKDGKVACECCEVGCCMYEAQALADALYTADDLPDDVTVNGTSFPRSGTTYGNTTSGVIFEENVWAKYTSGVRSSRPCLIQGGVEDQFAGEYEFSYFEYGTGELTYVSEEQIIVSRVSLCRWEMKNATFSYYEGEGLVTFQQDVVLEYSEVKWRVVTIYTGEDVMVSEFRGTKKDPQSAPDAPTGDHPFPDLAYYDDFVYL